MRTQLITIAAVAGTFLALAPGVQAASNRPSVTLSPVSGPPKTKVAITANGVIDNYPNPVEYYCPKLNTACGSSTGPGSSAVRLCARGGKVTGNTATCSGQIPAGASTGQHDVYSWQAKTKVWALATFTVTKPASGARS